jgi:hypothetical protein
MSYCGIRLKADQSRLKPAPTILLSLAVALGCSSALSAQRGRQGGTGEKPKVDVVQSVGCAERKAGNPETWWITRAAEPRVIQPGIFTTAQIETAKGAELGANSFQLVGVADFLDAEALLRSGQRKEFTTTENANATGQLREGRKILIKGMLVDAGDAKRINLLTVIALTDTCG